MDSKKSTMKTPLNKIMKYRNHYLMKKKVMNKVLRNLCSTC